MNKISFSIPAYNEEARIGACLESVLREIQQTECEAEVIVVDNGSTDTTAEIAASFPGVRVVREPKKGLTMAREAGFRAAQYELIAAIDSDTILPAGWLAKAFSQFDRDPTLIALGGPQHYYDLPWHLRATWGGVIWVQYMVYLINRFVLGRGSMLTGGNVVVKRAALEAIGGFNTNLEFWGEDADLATRLARVGKVSFVLSFFIYGTGRRILKEGVFTMMFVYSMNALSTAITGKPFSSTYDDVRTPPLGEKIKKLLS